MLDFTQSFSSFGYVKVIIKKVANQFAILSIDTASDLTWKNFIANQLCLNEGNCQYVGCDFICGFDNININLLSSILTCFSDF